MARTVRKVQKKPMLNESSLGFFYMGCRAFLLPAIPEYLTQINAIVFPIFGLVFILLPIIAVAGIFFSIFASDPLDSLVFS